MFLKKFKFISSFCILLISVLPIFAQYQQKASSAEILHDMQKLKNTARVLYLAAHPDDENTRFISYLVNDRKFETAYLALTRGDGGQNVIGSELREGLGLIRTQELLAARRTDGGKQFFTRANDFGYSKNPTETFNIWNREEVLADIVWVIRNFQPDIIVTRFNETPGITHGHHTASAILAHEAYQAAADKSKFSEQLKYVSPWATKKLYWNTSSWFFSNVEGFDESKYLKVDVGGYNSVLGESYTEIAAKSRSNHKSQAFGSTGTRGQEIELFEQWEGEKSKVDLFDGIETSWNKYPGGKKISTMIDELLSKYDPFAPEKSIQSLINIKHAITKLPNSANKTSKLELIDKLILKSSGFYHLISTKDLYASPGDSLNIHLELVNRSNFNLKIEKIRGNGFSLNELNLASLSNNEKYESNYKVKINKDTPISNPYWLNEEADLGMYKVKDQLLRGLPENSPALTLTIELTIEGESISIQSPVVFQTNDRIKGEVIEPFYITPPATLSFSDEVLIFTKPNQVREITLQVKALKNDISGTIKLNIPEGWETINNSHKIFQSLNTNESATFKFQIKSGEEFGNFKLGAEIKLTSDKILNKTVTEITYDHIPNQVMISDASAQLMFSDVRISDRIIGYIPGAGDKIPEALKVMGFQVDIIDLSNSSLENLLKYETIVAGIRAYNTNEALQNRYELLLEYTKAGGTYVVQYNTTYSLPNKAFFPFGLKLSRDRITNELAEMNFLVPENQILNFPNEISEKDFDGWVQERGLYFADSWGDEFTPVLEGSDQEESAKRGALLVANYGKGKFIYTGLSFFRELPAGVSGAYRLFSNIVSY